MSSYTGPDISTVAAMLAEKAEDFCRDFLRGGIKESGRWRCGDVYGNRGQSVSVPLIGSKAGKWRDFAAGVGGDLIDLLVANQNISKGEAFALAKKWLGYAQDGDKISHLRHDEARADARRAKAVQQATDEERQKSLRARRMVQQSRVADGTIVEAYFRARGITDPVPAALRLLPLHEHKSSGRLLPCMLAMVYAPVMPDGATAVVVAEKRPALSWEVIAVHRTWLEAEGLTCGEGVKHFLLEGHVLEAGKALCADPARVWRFKHKKNPDQKHDDGKMAYGPMKGGAIPLTPGPGKSTLAITEGIENGRSVAQANPTWSVWAAYSASNFASLFIPPAVTRLVLCGDGDSRPARDAQGNFRTDESGALIKPADVALEKAAQLHSDVAADEGRRLSVEIWRPEPGMDANDMLRKGLL